MCPRRPVARQLRRSLKHAMFAAGSRVDHIAKNLVISLVSGSIGITTQLMSNTMQTSSQIIKEHKVIFRNRRNHGLILNMRS